ncbi:hypothetical protein G1C96_0583 [Bifidobacterium sp. DSM 109958]|uniref:Uncharacterized protein n=2 Tax=Bifidobacterium moraviense TaxID=2675323 RepID=A0A7Y0HX81_9BIFI|nr:hypothetical protein [Bifidobacterium sp. DSM 109958]
MLAAPFPFDDFGLDCGFGCCDDYDGLPLPEGYADLPRTDAVPDPHPTGVTPVRPAAFPRPVPAAQAMPPIPEPAGERHGRCVPLGVCPTCGGMTER